MLLNNNIADVKPSATLAVNEKVKQLRHQNQQIIHWGFGQSPFPVPEAIQQALVANANNKHYLPGAGLSELRQAVSQHHQSYYDYHYQAEDVFVMPGSKEAIFQLLYLIEGTLLLPSPSWVSYEPQARLLGKDVAWLPSSFDDKYLLTAETLASWCDAHPEVKQKILILNSPNNPSGQQYDRETLSSVATVCQQQNIIVISDEIYAGVNFLDKPYASMTHFYPDGTIVTSGLSKLFSAGGYRLGYALIPDRMQPLKRALLTLISETFSCVSSPIQYAALSAYADYDQHLPYLKQCNVIHNMVADYICKGLNELNIECHAGQGAFYLLPSFKNVMHKWQKQKINDDITFCQQLLDEYHLALLPGCDFGIAPSAMTTRIATVDYDGAEALKASSIEAPCFNNIRQGGEILRGIFG